MKNTISFLSLHTVSAMKIKPTCCYCKSPEYTLCQCESIHYMQNLHLDTSKYSQMRICDKHKIYRTHLNISTGYRRKSGKKNQLMSDKNCFTTDTVGRREVKKFVSYGRLKTQKHLVSTGLPCSGFPFY